MVVGVETTAAVALLLLPDGCHCIQISAGRVIIARHLPVTQVFFPQSTQIVQVYQVVYIKETHSTHSRTIEMAVKRAVLSLSFLITGIISSRAHCSRISFFTNLNKQKTKKRPKSQFCCCPPECCLWNVNAVALLSAETHFMTIANKKTCVLLFSICRKNGPEWTSRLSVWQDSESTKKSNRTKQNKAFADEDVPEK